jgi:mannose-6-phosphate isomerase-like protein (cupin superfamily)
MSDYTHRNLRDVHNSAADLGFRDSGELRFAKDALDCERTGFTYHRADGGRHVSFGHRHDEAEEVYVVLSGSGRMKLDDDVIEIGPLDAVRVAPQVWRGFTPGPDGIEVLAFGPRHDGDGAIDPQWWVE